MIHRVLNKPFVLSVCVETSSLWLISLDCASLRGEHDSAGY